MVSVLLGDMPGQRRGQNGASRRSSKSLLELGLLLNQIGGAARGAENDNLHSPLGACGYCTGVAVELGAVVNAADVSWKIVPLASLAKYRLPVA